MILSIAPATNPQVAQWQEIGGSVAADVEPKKRAIVLGMKLKDFIRRKHRTQRAIEKALGWSTDYLSQLLNGHADLKLVQLLQVLEVLETTDQQFFAWLYQELERESFLEQTRRRSAIAGASGSTTTSRDLAQRVADVAEGKPVYGADPLPAQELRLDVDLPSRGVVESTETAPQALSRDETLELARALATAVLRSQRFEDIEARVERLERAAPPKE